MRFYEFYEDLVSEARNYSDEKFEVVSKKMANWLLDEFAGAPGQVIRMPMYTEFKRYLLNKGVDAQNEEDVILGFDNLESWLNELDSRLSQRFLTQVSQRYPAIANKIKFWNRPDDWKPSGRGRKPGSKNKPKSDDLTFTQVSVSEPETMVPAKPETLTPSEPKRRGRKPSEDSLRKLENQYEKMQDDLENHIRKMRDLMRQINQRRSYFGKNE